MLVRKTKLKKLIITTISSDVSIEIYLSISNLNLFQIIIVYTRTLFSNVYD